MSRSRGRRQSSLKGIPAFMEPMGPRLKFRWSISAAHLAILEEETAMMLPTIDTDRSQRKYFAASTFTLTDQQTVSHSSISTYKSSPLPNVAKQCQSPKLSEPEKSSPRISPLLLNYAQLHHISYSPQIQRQKQARFSIFSIGDDKRNSISLANRKISTTSRPSIPTAGTTALSPSKLDSRLANDNLVRLNTPQLRRLNVSEKYIHEAKKLYFDPHCRSFVPCVGVA